MLGQEWMPAEVRLNCVPAGKQLQSVGGSRESGLTGLLQLAGERQGAVVQGVAQALVGRGPAVGGASLPSEWHSGLGAGFPDGGTDPRCGHQFASFGCPVLLHPQ